MKIKALGTRGEIDASLPFHSKHSDVFINDELLLDLGEREFLFYSPKWTLITHEMLAKEKGIKAIVSYDDLEIDLFQI